jgi:small subunit ribosomal protein S8
MSDPIADLLTRIRNASHAQLAAVKLPHSKMKESIAHVLKREGYVDSVEVEGVLASKQIIIKLKYLGRKSIIEGLKRVSTPGLRRYVAASEIPRVRNGMGTAILSTSVGIMTGKDARNQNIGGELLCYIW